jgi:hypothetical protein
LAFKLALAFGGGLTWEEKWPKQFAQVWLLVAAQQPLGQRSGKAAAAEQAAELLGVRVVAQGGGRLAHVVLKKEAIVD